MKNCTSLEPVASSVTVGFETEALNAPGQFSVVAISKKKFRGHEVDLVEFYPKSDLEFIWRPCALCIDKTENKIVQFITKNGLEYDANILQVKDFGPIYTESSIGLSSYGDNVLLQNLY